MSAALSRPLRLGFLASRNGSSFRAVVAAIEAGRLAAEARLLVSNNRTAGAVAFARDRGVPVEIIATQADPEAADVRLCQALQRAGVELVVLSGYLRRLGPQTLAAYRHRVVNIHPALLPEFGGEGMYGRRVHEAVIAAGVSQSGATIHLVDEIYDNGAHVASRTVPVAPGDTAEALEARITEMEPAFYVETLQALATGELTLPN